MPDGNARRTAERPARGAAWLEALFPPGLRDAEISDRNRARVMVGVLLIAASVAISILIGRSGQGLPAVMTYAWSVLAISIGLVLAFRFGMSRVAVANGTMALYYGGSTGLVIASGGEAFPAVMTSSLLPAVAYGIQGRRAAIGWTGAVLAGIVVTGIYAQTTTEFLYGGNLLAWQGWRFPSMVLMVGFVLLAALGVDWMRERSATETNDLQNQIQRQAERYRDLVENVGDCMMEYDANFRAIYASPNWKELTGRAPEELLGRGYRVCIHADDMKTASEHSQALVETPGTTVKYRSRVQHVQGHWVEGEVSARTFYARNGDLHMVTIFRDLSELFRAQQSIRHRDRLATAGTLAAGIAHQINNPIGAIRNASEFALLTADEGDLEEIKNVLETNIEESARCGEIVRSLLQFASHEHPEKKARDLRGVVERSCGFARSFGGERHVRVDVSLGDVELPVEISQIEVEQVVINLVQNAIQAEPRSNRVEVVARRDGESAVVEVRDDGRGISDEDLEQVFDPFFTTRLSQGGSGLGLSVALGITREHGGKLEIESQEGEGSLVRLRLPLFAEGEASGLKVSSSG